MSVSLNGLKHSDTLNAPIDKRLSHYPFTVKSRVRIPLGVQSFQGFPPLNKVRLNKRTHDKGDKVYKLTVSFENFYCDITQR